MLERLSMTAEPGSTTIMVTRLFDAPPSAVFEAWTKAEHVAQWWDPSGAPLAVCEIASPHGLVFAARTFPSSPESIATLSFIEDNGGTKFIMTIECQSIEDRNALLAMRVDVGTARTLENLAPFLHKISRMERGK